MMDPQQSVDAELVTDDGVCVLTHTPLDVQAIINSVGSDEAGATAVFIGTTRNSFKGKVVLRLEYQAYSKLAIKTMSSILHQARINAISSPPPHSASVSVSAPTPNPTSASDLSPDPSPSPSPSSDPAPNPTPNPNNLIHSTIHHRLGPVPVGSPSIVIAVSSPHRQSAFRACEFILEQVKSRAQIWKREFYDCDGVDDCEADAIWKDNRS